MTAFHDDDLRSMLEARADRLAPSTAGRVMSGVRDEIRGPRQGAAFSVLPVLTGRSSSIGAGWLAAAMVAMVMMVVVATRPQVAAPSPSSGGTAPGGIIGSPSALSSPGALDASMSITQLRGVVNDGSADGKLFAVTTTLEQSPNVFCAQDPCATQFDLAFVGGVITDARRGLNVMPARPAEGAAPFEGTFVVTPWKGSLVLVGMLTAGTLSQPVDARTLAPARADTGPEAIGIAAVSDRLVWRGPACPTVLPDGSACVQYRTWYLQSASSTADLTPVSLVDPTLGIDLSQIDQVDGPFLVRTGTGSQATLVARYDASEVHVVRSPVVSCDAAQGTALPSCRKLMQLALESWSILGEVYSVEVHHGAWTCPAAGMCHDVPPAQSAYVIVHASTGDWMVGLAFDERGSGLDVVPMPMPSASPAASPSPSAQPLTTCAELGYGQESTLTCGAAVAAALKVVPEGTSVVSIDFGYGRCAPMPRCVAPLPGASPDPNVGWVVVHEPKPAPDLLVSVRADDGGLVTVADPVPLDTGLTLAPSP